MIDYTKIQMVSSSSSNKLVPLVNSDSFTLPALGGAGEVTATATIPHGFGSDNLLFQVSADGATTSGVILPWQSNDGRISLYADVDATNLYVTGISSDSSGFGAPAYTIIFYYRVLVP
ncbi:hypothetical protein UFOVP253_35 [uncultured Caudovirales phage]|uniref:Uncharacterized protein n=1 Tax=uncultured Caudovirales phage TaxID=2100421 RepID=A0A6J5LH27_9CAUD|nr:hypothetical protein UFOVP253_35 [uncultured Caudovirales phage]